jgi:hypothetical protein
MSAEQQTQLTTESSKAKKSFASRIGGGIATFVRGPFFLSVISVVLLAVAIPAQATLLRGYLQQSTSAVAVGEDYQPDSVNPESTKLHRAMIAENSFPQTFAGVWKCVTVVVDSAVASIPVGQRLESAVNFVQTNDGRVVARWEQQGWTEAQASVVPVSANEVNLERTNYFTESGLRGGWAAHSRDKYLQIDANRIAATSMVEQFIDGKFLGQYQTKSMLYRVSGDLALAKP